MSGLESFWKSCSIRSAGHEHRKL